MKIQTTEHLGGGKAGGLAEIAPIGFLIGTVAKHLKRTFDEQAKKHDLTLPQWRVLSQLVTEGGMTQSVLAGAVETDPMTISGILDRLEARGLVLRTQDASDSRAKIVSATDAARDLIAVMRGVAAQVYDVALDGIAADARAALVETLTKISDNLADQRDRRQDASK